MGKIGRRKRLETAHHEAARCIAAIAHGLSVESVSVLPADGPAGTAGAAHLDRAIYFADDDPSAQVEALRVDITVTLARPAAQMRLRPAKHNHPEWADALKLAEAWSTWAAFLASGVSGVNIAEFGPDGLIELSEEERAFADRLLR